MGIWSRTVAIEVYFRFELFVFVLKTKKKRLISYSGCKSPIKYATFFTNMQSGL
jgi:hypothetical protein